MWAVRADARESLAGRDMRAYGAGEAAEPPTAQQTTPKSLNGKSSKTTSREKTLRFCSKTVPERGRRALRRRSGERPVALQELPQNAGYSVRFPLLRQGLIRVF